LLIHDFPTPSGRYLSWAWTLPSLLVSKLTSSTTSKVDAEDERNGVGRPERVVAEQRPDLACLARRVHAHPAVERARERVEAELKGRDDAEVPAGATQAPEQVGLLGLARPDDTAVGRHELDRGDAVQRETEPALQPADAAPEGEAGDAGVSHHTDRADKPVLLAGNVEPVIQALIDYDRNEQRAQFGNME